jgi:hypothetical protein
VAEAEVMNQREVVVGDRIGFDADLLVLVAYIVDVVDMGFGVDLDEEMYELIHSDMAIGERVDESSLDNFLDMEVLTQAMVAMEYSRVQGVAGMGIVVDLHEVGSDVEVAYMGFGA